MEVGKLAEIIGAEFYTGIPDSLLRAFCDYLMDVFGINSKHHIIAANEGNCTALAAGYYLATGKVPVVYMQNSGEGNVLNPVASLLNDKVYAIPMIFIVGWRGEPETYDEPQHIFQGEVTVKMLEDNDIRTFIISKDTKEDEVVAAMETFRRILDHGKQVAFIVRKDSITYGRKIKYANNSTLSREEIIKHIVDVSGEDPIVSTTGKASRELFEIRSVNGQSHKYDFLTVGSMGHCSSIALGIAIHKPKAKIWCIDGDAAALMHMGAIAVLGAYAPKNLVHVIINNRAHATVGGMPTVAEDIDFAGVARACSYPYAVCVDNLHDLDQELRSAKEIDRLTLIEVICSLKERQNLGRPTVTPIQNKQSFMEYLLTF